MEKVKRAEGRCDEVADQRNLVEEGETIEYARLAAAEADGVELKAASFGGGSMTVIGESRKAEEEERNPITMDVEGGVEEDVEDDVEEDVEEHVEEEVEEDSGDSEGGSDSGEWSEGGAKEVIPKAVIDSLRSASKAVTELQDNLGPLLKFQREVSSFVKKSDSENVSSLDRAKLNLLVAQVAMTVFCLLLKTEGIAIDEQEAVKKEVERVSKYGRKVASEEARLRNLPDDAALAAGPGVGLDVAAASRFIAGGLPDLTMEQRRKLREAGQRRKREQEEERIARKKSQVAEPNSDAKSGSDVTAGDSTIGSEQPKSTKASAAEFLSSL